MILKYYAYLVEAESEGGAGRGEEQVNGGEGNPLPMYIPRRFSGARKVPEGADGGSCVVETWRA